MTTILRIQSGGDLRGSITRQIGQEVVDRLRVAHPGAVVVSRDLVTEPVPHIGAEFVTTMFTDRADALVLSNQLIEELFASDILLIESPMYNFSIPSVLKAWIDHVVRVRKTYRYAAGSVEGLLKGKRAILVLGSGAVYSDGQFKALDFQEPYLRATLGWVGITDVETLRVEGLNYGAETAAQAIAKARARVDQVVATAA